MVQTVDVDVRPPQVRGENSMNIFEFADIINRNIEITRHANQNGRYTAQFEHCEIKDGICLRGVYGEGRTPSEAVEDYAKKITGQTLVFYAMSDELRQEYVVPTSTVTESRG